MVKKFILNADDFGLSEAINRAVLEGYQDGLLKSASLVANGLYFEDAIKSVLPECKDLGVGIHLNVTSGISLCEDLVYLTDSCGNFNNSFFKILLQSYSFKNQLFFDELEREFRLQIEKVLSKVSVTHIDSHNHIHSIPRIFNMVCRLAKEYGIYNIRTHFELPYVVPDLKKHFSFKYFKNLFRVLYLQYFTIFNEAKAYSFGLKTNDYIIGLIYDSMMESLTVSYGVMAVKYDNIVVETIIHPSRYEDGTVNNRFDEFLLTKNKKLKEKIEHLGYIITNYAEK